MKKQLPLVALIVCAANAPLSFSDNGFYAGLGLGQSDYKLKLRGWGSASDKQGSYAIRGGYKFNQHLAVELSLSDFGSVKKSKHRFFLKEKQSLESQSVGVAVVGLLPISNNINVHGKVGVETWEADLRQSVTSTIYGSVGYSDKENFEGEDIFWSVGAGYAFSESFVLNVDYEYHSWDKKQFDLENDNISVSLNYHF